MFCLTRGFYQASKPLRKKNAGPERSPQSCGETLQTLAGGLLLCSSVFLLRNQVTIHMPYLFALLVFAGVIHKTTDRFREI